MEAHRKGHAPVYANVGVHGNVAITLAIDTDGGEGASIYFGHDGPDLIMDVADVDSLDRLAAVAADGARRLRARITANRERAAATNAGAALLAGAEVTR